VSEVEDGDGLGVDGDAVSAGVGEASGEAVAAGDAVVSVEADAVGVGDVEASCAETGPAMNVPSRPIKSNEAIRLFLPMIVRRRTEASLENDRI
jgi:hypothetical protein